MDLNFTPDEIAFRDEVRAFIKANLPHELSRKVIEHKRLSKEDYVTWQKILHAQGWIAPHWPVEHGGCGWNPVQRHILEEESAAAGAPPVIAFGVYMVGPVIYTFGSPWQKQHYLPRILSSEDWWCQGYSEPGSGSDLASLRTRAVREGDYYIVNGQKTWTTLAQYADMMFCLVRTSAEGKKQDGISFLLIDMRTPGLEVRPIITLDGEHEVNEVWLQDVKVPVQNLVGEEGRGWTYAKFLLSNERTGIAAVSRSKRELAYLKAIASKERSGGRPLIESPMFRDKIARVEIDIMALEITVLRVLSADRQGKPLGPEASILKIKGTEIQQALTELMMEAVGPYALPHLPAQWSDHWLGERVGPDYAAPLAARYFNYRKVSIYGGSNEIQRNIIAQSVLGL
ncbi:MAG: acyl-CoA dehydrogenase family protein [Betaproteobacteria bacterium]|nr:acyl-CoA dehydrogenase family protein [Betaproteobacteria bacterium]